MAMTYELSISLSLSERRGRFSFDKITFFFVERVKKKDTTALKYVNLLYLDIQMKVQLMTKMTMTRSTSTSKLKLKLKLNLHAYRFVLLDFVLVLCIAHHGDLTIPPVKFPVCDLC
jgi:hypothetical protein